ncbi:MAG: DUF3089 domain-containing protein [Lachnospiraceae bacterium]|nr:DUF3089 domain-containing protein [Lachnospiraceae bacterium]
MKRIWIVPFAFIVLTVSISLSGCFDQTNATDYSDHSNWSYFETDTTDTIADVFFVCPTVYFGSDDSYNMELTDEDAKADFLGATNMEKGIYDHDSRFFAPYYRQVGLNVYTMETRDREQYLELAFDDVKNAFEYYYETCNDGRPIILVGFSQGADMCIRLMKECFTDENIQNQLIACYAIGWSITEEEIHEYPQLKFAEGESDTGVIISFNSEAEFIDNSLPVPNGTKTLAINPLNWKTDGAIADKSLNLGACFTDYDGNIIKEINNLTGAYIDEVRGTLKVTDVTPEEYPAGLDIFEDGIYHLYDYQFFYRNLQKNVQTRMDAYITNQGQTTHGD